MDSVGNSKKTIAVLAALQAVLSLSVPVAAQVRPPAIRCLVEAEDQARVLILGTFHFRDSGRNEYDPEHVFNVFSPEGQAQIAEVVDSLAKFRATKIAIEAPPSYQATLDSLYGEYLGGDLEPNANEIVQLGFRLGKRLGHRQLYAIDAERNDFFRELYRQNQDLVEAADSIDADLESAYRELYSVDDALKTTWTLREHYLYLNSRDRIRQGHGAYFIGSFFKVEGDDGFLGPDLTTGWFNRNLRIFRNLQRIAEGPADRIVVIYGSGHLPILRDAIEASPEFELVEVYEYLADPPVHEQAPGCVGDGRA